MKKYDSPVNDPAETGEGCRRGEASDLLLSKTPFYLETGWELVTENKNLPAAMRRSSR